MHGVKKKKIYVLPIFGDKSYKYSCPECESEVILKQGKKNRHHFAHKESNNCVYYDNPSDKEMHKNAKMYIKNLLENGYVLEITKNCKKCRKSISVKRLEKTNDIDIKSGCKLKINGEIIISDIVMLNNKTNKVECIIEIYNTNNTDEPVRPEPWIKLSASKIISKTYENNDVIVDYKCCREYFCDKCTEKKYIGLTKGTLEDLIENYNNLEFYVRYTLRQRETPYTSHTKCKYINDDNDNNYKYNNDIYNEQRINYKRFNFDARDDNNEIEKNNGILSLFGKWFAKKNKYIVLHSCKGSIWYYISDKPVSREYDEYYYEKDKYDCDGKSTVDIIIRILKQLSKKK